MPDRRAGAVLAVPTLMLLAAFALGLLVIDHMDGIALFGLAICGVLFWAFAGRSWMELPGTLLWAGLAFSLLPLAAEASMLANAGNAVGFGMLGRVGRWFCFLPVAMAIWSVRERLTPRILGWLLLGGSAIASAVAAYQAFGRGMQAGGAVGVAIVFGDLLAIQTFAGFYLLLKNRRGAADTAALAVGGALGLGGIVMSGSRGALLILVVLLLLVGATTVRRYPLRSAAVAAGAVLVAGIVIAASPLLSGRYALSLKEIRSWKSGPPIAAHPAGAQSLSSCPNSDAVLRSLIERAASKGEGRTSLSRAGSMGSAFPWLDCNGGSAISVENTSGKGIYVVHFPRAVSLGGSTPALAIAQGTGRIRIANASSRNDVTVDTRRPRLVVVKGGSGQSGYLTVILRSAERLKIIPVQIVPGEYVFPRAAGSLAKRVRLWEAAFDAFLQRPLLGNGLGSFRATTAEFASTGRLPSYLSGTYEHPHNDLLWMLQWGGIAGAVAYCAVVLIPLLGFARLLRSGSIDRVAGVVGVGTCLGVLVGGATEALFAHALFNSWLTVVYALILVCAYSGKKTRGAVASQAMHGAAS